MNKLRRLSISGFFAGISVFYIFSIFPILQPIPVLAAQNNIYHDSAAISSGDSTNWAGYVATGGTFTGVTGTWTVPTVNSGTSVSADASWVGIGGINSNDLIQAGTQAVETGNNIVYEAWVETLPNPSQPLSLTVKPGDSVTVSITQESTGIWLVKFTDNTTGINNSETIDYSSSLSSAEWIEERPEINNFLPTLDNFNSIDFTGATAIENGSSIPLGQLTLQKLDMYSTNNTLLASTGVLGTDNQSFTVNRSSNNDTTTLPSAIPGTQISGFIPHTRSRGRNRQFLISPNFKLIIQSGYGYGFSQ
jgi:hypothetical protein